MSHSNMGSKADNISMRIVTQTLESIPINGTTSINTTNRSHCETVSCRESFLHRRRPSGRSISAVTHSSSHTLCTVGKYNQQLTCHLEGVNIYTPSACALKTYIYKRAKFRIHNCHRLGRCQPKRRRL